MLFAKVNPPVGVLTIITRLPVVELKADALKRLLYAQRRSIQGNS